MIEFSQHGREGEEMGERTRIKEALTALRPGADLLVNGWVRTIRVGKDVAFLAVNDGSCFASLQVVAAPELPNYDELCRTGTGAAVVIRGTLVPSPAAGQTVELRATAGGGVGGSGENYPLQKQR